MLLKYLLRTTIAGGIAGAAHGMVSLHHFHKQEPLEKTMYVAVHAQTGAIIGPWLPILIPIWLTLDGSNQNTRCPMMKGGVYYWKYAAKSLSSKPVESKPDLPTVAEKP